MGKQTEMNTSIALEVMESELKSVKQNGKCKCDCEKCNLTYKCDELVEVYEWVIGLLKEKKKIEEELRKFSNRMAEIGQYKFGKRDDI